jgi:uncharacterized UPF0160 family protein
MNVQAINQAAQFLINQIEAFRKKNPKGVVIGTHPGSFHPDDACAVATLLLKFPGSLVVRTRSEAVLALCTFRVDVGGKYNPKTGDYDHHQEGGAGKRTNGIEYSSFGLVWSEYGAQVAGDERVARFADKILVQTVDAIDNGQQLAIPNQNFQGARPYDISQFLSNLNPAWDEDAEVDTCFMEAVAMAKMTIKRIIERTQANNRAQSFVRRAVKNAADPRIIVLEKSCPWKGVIVKEVPNARFVVFPNDEGMWCVQAITARFGTFENRLNLPAHWAKTNGRSFADISGVADADFIHQKLFFCTAQSREGALKLAKLALEQEKPAQKPKPTPQQPVGKAAPASAVDAFKARFSKKL